MSAIRIVNIFVMTEDSVSIMRMIFDTCCFLLLQVHQVFCDIDSICLDGLGIIFPPYNITIEHSGAYKTMFHVNNEIRSLDNPLQLRSNTRDNEENVLTVRKSSSRVYELSDEVLGLYMHVTIMSNHLIVDVGISQSTCESYTSPGLCGPCSQTSINDIYRRSTSDVIILDPNDTAEDIAKKVEQGRECVDNLFEIDGPCEAVTTYAGTALALRNSAAVVESPAGFSNDYTTLELLVKSCNTSECGGTILSYSSSKSFFVSTASGTISLHYDNTNLTTGIRLEDNAWTHLSLVWDRESSHLDLYVFNSTGYPQRRSYVLPGDIFPAGGTLALGKWQPSGDGSGFVPQDVFTGEIDELRIWDR